MATVMPMPNVPVAELDSEDGLTSQQRKAMYRLIVAGEVSASPSHDHDYTITTALGFNPGLYRELRECLKHLIKLGLVQQLTKTEPSLAYGKTPVVTLSEATYRPVFGTGVGPFVSEEALRRPVLAWLYLYGPLKFEEYRTHDNETRYKSLIAAAMGEPESATDKLLADVDYIAKSGLASVYINPEKRPAKWHGGHGQMHDVMVNDVTIELIN